MTIVIKKGATKEEVERLLLQLDKKSKKKGLKQFYGKFSIEGDAVEIQKKLRDEWD